MYLYIYIDIEYYYIFKNYNNYLNKQDFIDNFFKKKISYL